MKGSLPSRNTGQIQFSPAADIWDSMTHAADIAKNQPLDPASNAITPRWAAGLISRNAVKAAPNGTARLVPELRHAV